MRNRCNNPNADDFAHYGGRGIRICARWNSFPNFIEDLGPRPSLAHSLDRIDPDKNYSKSNCRWATRLEQSRNRRYCKLDLKAAREIRKAHAAGGFKIETFKAKFNCGDSAIYEVLRGRSWAE